MVDNSSPKPVTAAVLLIGNELLSGKVQEANLAVLAKAFRAVGIRVVRAVFVEDVPAVIAAEVKHLSASFDWVVTSGGVGPTHDDVTVEGIASAFGVSVVSDPEMESMLRERYGERCTEAHLRMALMPEGAAREVTREIRWPTLRMQNVWILPGVPEIFRMKLPVVVDFLRSKHPTGSFTSRAVYTQMDEGDLKPLLDDVVAKFPDVEVGSYPKWFDPTYKTKLTFDGLSQTQVLAARDFFVARLPPGEPQPIEDPRE